MTPVLIGKGPVLRGLTIEKFKTVGWGFHRFNAKLSTKFQLQYSSSKGQKNVEKHHNKQQSTQTL